MTKGTFPSRPPHTNYDYIKTHHPELYAGTRTLSEELQIKTGSPSFPDEYFTDSDPLFRNQNSEGLPDACTSYATSAIAINLGVSGATPQDLEAITHSNALGGFTLIGALDIARKILKWLTATYQVKAYQLDYFDTFRLAQMSGIPEKRSVTLGMPWLPSTENAALSGTKILPMPSQDELQRAINTPFQVVWHNPMLDGFTTINGQQVYRVKSWQGPSVDYLYFTREYINTIMQNKYCVAYTATNTPIDGLTIQTIDMSIVDKWISYIRTWIGIQ